MDVKALVRVLPAGALGLAVLLGSCGDDPTGAGRGVAAALILDRITTNRSVGEQFQLTARIEDVQRTRLLADITATSSNASVRVDSIQAFPELQESRIFLTAVAMGTATVTVSGAGLMEEVAVAVYPASIQALALIGGEAQDTLGSGEVAELQVIGLNTSGVSIGPVPYTITSAGTASVVAIDGTTLSARAPGSTQIQITGPGGGLVTTLSLTVVPGTFAGTFGPNNGTGGDTLVITAGPGAPFDANTSVGTMGGYPVYVVSLTASEIRAILPFGLDAGTYNVNVTNIGPGELAQGFTYTLATRNDVDPYEPNNSTLTAAVVGWPVIIVGSTSGSDIDDFFLFTPTADGNYPIRLEWDAANGSGDLDVIVRNHLTGANQVGCTRATAAVPETGTCTLTGGTVYRIQVNDYNADIGVSTAVTTYKLTIGP